MALSSLSDILSLKSNSCLLTDYLFLIKKKKKKRFIYRFSSMVYRMMSNKSSKV